MGRHSWGTWGAGLALLGCGLGGTPALAAEPLVRVSVFASEQTREQTRDFTPWANLGATFGTKAEADSGWLFGASLSVNAGTVLDPTPWGDPAARVQDNGSALFLRFRPEGWGPGEDASLTLYPLDSSRLRLGWAYPATWAGNFKGRWESTATVYGTWRRTTQGLRLQVRRERWHAFAAVKVYGVAGTVAPMAGAGMSLPGAFRAEVQAAYMQRDFPAIGYFGVDPVELPEDLEPGFDPVQGLGVGERPPRPYSRGLSARLVHEQGGPVGKGVDFGLYGTAPTLFEDVFQPEAYTEGFAHSVSLEATHSLISGYTSGVPRSANANIVALDARVRWNRLRVTGLGLLRSGGAVVHDDSDLWWEFFQSSRRRPELGVCLGVDYHLAAAGLTPGLGVRVVRPAAHQRPPSVTTPEQPSTWWLVSSEGIYRMLREDQAPEPIVSARATLKWDLLRWVSAAGELSYTWERDTLSPVKAPSYAPGRLALAQRDVNQAGLGFNLLVQARY